MAVRPFDADPLQGRGKHSDRNHPPPVLVEKPRLTENRPGEQPALVAAHSVPFAEHRPGAWTCAFSQRLVGKDAALPGRTGRLQPGHPVCT